MSIIKSKRSLKFKGVRLPLYELSDKVWLLASDVGGLIDRDSEYLVSRAPNLFTSRMTAMVRIPALGRNHKRRILTIAGARLMCAIATTPAAMGMFYMLAKLDSQGRPKHD